MFSGIRFSDHYGKRWNYSVLVCPEVVGYVMNWKTGISSISFPDSSFGPYEKSQFYHISF